MRRTFTLLLAITMIICSVLFTSCGKSDNTASNLEKIKAAGVLKVGMECAYAPFNWTQTDEANGAVKIANADGYANGYDVQIAQKLADAIGVKLEVYAYEWGALIPAVQSGALDAIIAGMSPTDERKETIDFTSNYWVSNLVVITSNDSAIANAASLADLSGSKIGAQAATFHEEAVTQIENVTPTILDDFTLLYTALKSGTIDGYIAEEPTAWAICGDNDALTYVALVNNTTGFTASDSDVAVAVGIRKGSDLGAELTKAIDAITSDAKSALMQQMVALAPVE
ncbi:MAG: transporter substrate-binding domain-containing protein [Clostridia bacterium]|nr:transporter substrate-binding domain-containing protein [Clostridia bacterium]